MSVSFPPIYVISLARAKERREAMRARLNKLGTPYEFIDAVDGATADAALYESRLRRDKFRRKFGREMMPGEIGCYLSHYNLWRRIADEKIPCSLVLEDDAAWDNDLIPVCEAIAMLEWRWTVVLLSAEQGKWSGLLLATVGDRRRRLTLFPRRVVTAAGYMISQRGAAMLLEWCREISAPVDVAYAEWWRSKIPYYGVMPPVVRQVGADSQMRREADIKWASLPDRIIASLWRKYDRLHCRVCYWQTSARKERGEE